MLGKHVSSSCNLHFKYMRVASEACRLNSTGQTVRCAGGPPLGVCGLYLLCTYVTLLIACFDMTNCTYNSEVVKIDQHALYNKIVIFC